MCLIQLLVGLITLKLASVLWNTAQSQRNRSSFVDCLPKGFFNGRGDGDKELNRSNTATSETAVSSPASPLPHAIKLMLISLETHSWHHTISTFNSCSVQQYHIHTYLSLYSLKDSTERAMPSHKTQQQLVGFGWRAFFVSLEHAAALAGLALLGYSSWSVTDASALSSKRGDCFAHSAWFRFDFGRNKCDDLTISWLRPALFPAAWVRRKVPRMGMEPAPRDWCVHAKWFLWPT